MDTGTEFAKDFSPERMVEAKSDKELKGSATKMKDRFTPYLIKAAMTKLRGLFTHTFSRSIPSEGAEVIRFLFQLG
jgi:hypothetical protein